MLHASKVPVSQEQLGYMLEGPFSIDILWRCLIGPPDDRPSGQFLADPRSNEGAVQRELSKHQFPCMRDSAHHVLTRETFWSHVCDGPAPNTEVGRTIGCPGTSVSEISSPAREGPPGPLSVGLFCEPCGALKGRRNGANRAPFGRTYAQRRQANGRY